MAIQSPLNAETKDGFRGEYLENQGPILFRSNPGSTDAFRGAVYPPCPFLNLGRCPRQSEQHRKCGSVRTTGNPSNWPPRTL